MFFNDLVDLFNRTQINHTYLLTYMAFWEGKKKGFSSDGPCCLIQQLVFVPPSDQRTLEFRIVGGVGITGGVGHFSGI